MAPSVDLKDTPRRRRAEIHDESAKLGSTSVSVWIMIFVGSLLSYISGFIYIIEVYLQTVDDDGIPDEVIFGEPIAVVAIKYGTGVTSKMYDYVSLAGRILSVVGACILSLSFHYSPRRLIQIYSAITGMGMVSLIKPMFYQYRQVSESELSVPFKTIMGLGLAGFLLTAVAVYWADVFTRVTQFKWARFGLNTLVVIGVLFSGLCPLVGAISCSRGGTFMPEVVLFGISFWLVNVPFIYLVWRIRYSGKSSPEPRFYTPESTPILLPPKSSEDDKIN